MLPKEFDRSLLQDPSTKGYGIVAYEDGVVLYDSGSATYSINSKVDPSVPGSTSIQRLMKNQLYTVQLVMPDAQVIGFEFTSSYDPLYSSVGIIRQDLGDIVADLTDDEINFKIYQVSQMAQQLAGQAQRYILYGSAVGNIILQFQGVSRSDMQNAIPFPAPFFVQQYVRFKTELEFVYAKYINLSAQMGMMEKTLGDFKIARQITLPRLQELLSDLKKDLEEWEFQLRGGGNAKPKRTIRARTSTYSLSRAGSLGGFNLGGTGSAAGSGGSAGTS